MSSKSREGRLARIFIANIARSAAATISTLPTRDTGTPTEPVFEKSSAMRDPSGHTFDILGLIRIASQCVSPAKLGGYSVNGRNSSWLDRRRASRRSSNERSAESLRLPGLGTWSDETVRREIGGRHGAQPRRGTTLAWSVSPTGSATGVPELRLKALLVEGCPIAKNGETLYRGGVPGDLSIGVSL